MSADLDERDRVMLATAVFGEVGGFNACAVERQGAHAVERQRQHNHALVPIQALLPSLSHSIHPSCADMSLSLAPCLLTMQKAQLRHSGV